MHAIHAYPLPKQDTISQALGGRIVFSSLDIVKSFFQQLIKESDQWKTASSLRTAARKCYA
jgi:hypothetical protein